MGKFFFGLVFLSFIKPSEGNDSLNIAVASNFNSTLQKISFQFEKKEKLKIQNHFISGDNFSLKFFDINSREEAESLKNKDLFIEPNQLKKLDDETWYHSEIVGLSVETMKGNLVGEVKAIYNFGAGDIIEIKLISGKIEMIPFTKDFVQEIKINNKLIIKETDN